ncbi:MAG: ABC transporter ATP-binding protein [Dethiobacter sp.]|jgi:putative ABC transport system ATP-binding protein|nr:ABC transporter ATP-binding protein [Dethiobacter sp.]MCL4462433.1 ABC transporter ATP-binding protein [Bacillota bacterium]MCL5993268.1 ABC transporter ATP-binding protein [Bacillota bacterium]
MAILALRDIVKKYRMGDSIVTALDNLSITVEEGEFVAVVGTSGCGKTTLLNIAAGLERPTKGEVLFRNVTLNKLKEKDLVLFRQRVMGFVFQGYNLLPALTALENVALPLVFAGIARKERLSRAMQMLELVGLADRSRHKPMEMSGGQQQRVSVARALVSRPKIVFADEPTGNLDTRTSVEIVAYLRDAVKNNRQTLVFVTHDSNIAGIADRIIYLSDGKLVNE